MTILHNDEIVARTDHKCSFCEGTIMRGERYRNMTFVYEDRICAQKTHLHCDYVFSELIDYWKEESLVDDLGAMFSDYACDILSEKQHDEYAKLTYPEKWKYMYNFIKHNDNEKATNHTKTEP